LTVEVGPEAGSPSGVPQSENRELDLLVGRPGGDLGAARDERAPEADEEKEG
jgi:hypothetical protein